MTNAFIINDIKSDIIVIVARNETQENPLDRHEHTPYIIV